MARNHLDVLCVPTLLEGRALCAIFSASEDVMVVVEDGTKLVHPLSLRDMSVELSLVAFAVLRPVRVAFRATNRLRTGFVYWGDGCRFLATKAGRIAFDGHYVICNKSPWASI